MNRTPPRDLVLLTGATGYVGGRLLGALRKAGRRVRCIAREPEILRSRVAADTEIVRADVLDSESMAMALGDVDAAYYLVHSMGATGSFEETDRAGARTFAAAARAAGVRRIIYLGGLGEPGAGLSPHLRSRHEVGRLLRASGVDVIEFRASIIIGSGSLSFEMIRALVERLPVMITPRWVSIPAQPIAVTDVLAYLVAALDLPSTGHRTFEIGGADRVSYAQIMREYARQRGLRRLMIPVPFLTPHLSSLWLGLVTPLYARVGRKLIDSIRHSTVVTDDSALTVFSIRPKGVAEAVRDALQREDQEFGETRWSDALSAAGAHRPWGGTRFGTKLVVSRTVDVTASPAAAFAVIQRIGGVNGWYYGDWLWRLRGWLDLLIGGVGMRRGRRDPTTLRVGDVVDCWRVEAVDAGRRLRFQAEMRLPGRAWLEFETEPVPGGTRLRQTAIFDPVGLWGLTYWYGVYPLHRLLFAGMLRGIARGVRLARPDAARDDEPLPPSSLHDASGNVESLAADTRERP